MQTRAAKHAERDAKVRLLLKPMLDTVREDTDKIRITEALTLLEPPKEPSS